MAGLLYNKSPLILSSPSFPSLTSLPSSTLLLSDKYYSNMSRQSTPKNKAKKATSNQSSFFPLSSSSLSSKENANGHTHISNGVTKNKIKTKAGANSNNNNNNIDTNSTGTGSKSSLWNIPNILTILRVIAIPILMISFLAEKYIESSIIFALASLTDYLDGYLARKWNIVSNFGAFLDPVADKLMVATCLILLAGRCNNTFMTIFTTIILMREITISALREWMASCSIRNVVAVGWWGKVKTATTMIALIFRLADPAISVVSSSFPISSSLSSSSVSSFLHFLGIKLNGGAHTTGQFGMVLLLISTVLTITSAWGYLKAAAPYLLK